MIELRESDHAGGGYGYPLRLEHEWVVLENPGVDDEGQVTIFVQSFVAAGGKRYSGEIRLDPSGEKDSRLILNDDYGDEVAQYYWTKKFWEVDPGIA